MATKKSPHADKGYAKPAPQKIVKFLSPPGAGRLVGYAGAPMLAAFMLATAREEASVKKALLLQAAQQPCVRESCCVENSYQGVMRITRFSGQYGLTQ